MINTCLLGLGRTGTVVAEHLAKSPEFNLLAVFTRPKSPKVNQRLDAQINTHQQLVIQDVNKLAAMTKSQKIQVAIDFTNPKAALKNARILAQQGVHLVIGTTGFSKPQLNELRRIAEQYRIGLVYAPNISIGINILLFIIRTMARLLPGYDVEITECHHRNKKDAPSGTALKIAASINETKGVVAPRLVFGRYGATNRVANEIGIHAVRAGGIVGVHQVLFSGYWDEIEVTHRSYSRAVFAEGALKAAKFVLDQPGFFSMEDVLQEAKQPKGGLTVISDRVVHWWQRMFSRSFGCGKGLAPKDNRIIPL